MTQKQIGKLIVQNLKVHCIVGLLPFERLEKQDLFIDIKAECDFSTDAQSDSLIKNPSYVDIAEKLSIFIQEGEFELLETIALRGSQYLFNIFPSIESIELEIRKPAAYSFANHCGVQFKLNRTFLV